MDLRERRDIVQRYTHQDTSAMSCFVVVEDSRSDTGIAGGGDTVITRAAEDALVIRT
jgi:hypothetical protein